MRTIIAIIFLCLTAAWASGCTNTIDRDEWLRETEVPDENGRGVLGNFVSGG